MKSRSWPTVIMLVLDWVIRCNNVVKLFSKDYMLFKQKVGSLTSVLNVITVYQGGVCYGTAFWEQSPIRAIALNMRQYINHNVHQCSWWTPKSFLFHLGLWFWSLLDRSFPPSSYRAALERWVGWLPSSIMRSFDVLVLDTGSSSFSMVWSKLLIIPTSGLFFSQILYKHNILTFLSGQIRVLTWIWLDGVKD